MKKVMLIGDSIRLGYQAKVAERLSKTALVSGPQDNCRFSSYTLFYLATWVPDDDFDLIQWNNGVKRYISGDMVHLTEAGNDLCAGRIAGMIENRHESRG